MRYLPPRTEKLRFRKINKANTFIITPKLLRKSYSVSKKCTLVDKFHPVHFHRIIKVNKLTIVLIICKLLATC